MDELEAIRQRKAQELQEQAEFQSQVNQLESVIKTLFTKEALERYGNLKSAHPEKAVQLLAVIGQITQKGNVKKITDEQLINLLKKMQPKKKEIKITRK